jgi:hypothetical protein
MSLLRRVPECSCLLFHECRILIAASAICLWAQSPWPPQGEYAGSEQCATCHPAQAQSYRSSGMAKAFSSVALDNTHFQWSDGQFSYAVDGRSYHVSGGGQAAAASLLFAFGKDGGGQTFLFESEGAFYETRVSYFKRLGGLALTIGAEADPRTATEALGRKLSPDEARDCFGCHTTGARRGGVLQLHAYEEGVGCEACHGPGATHISNVRRGKPRTGDVHRLGGMGAEAVNDLCGACHRTFETVLSRALRGVNNVRFQPYRITRSRCFSDDSRIACTACHDPHRPLETDSKLYDAKCIVCHSRTSCRVGKEGCVSCHMPQVELSRAFRTFTDHRIRIVRVNERYPD